MIAVINRNNNNLFFSIIMPVHNAELFLHRSIGSVLTQTFESFELLLIVNRSKDNSLNIAKAFSNVDERIHAFSTDAAGISNARNIGIRNANGEYIVFLDADDSFMPGTLEKMHYTLMHEGFGAPILFTSSDQWLATTEKTVKNRRCLFEPANKLYMTSLAAEGYQEDLNSVLRKHPRIRRVLTPPWGKAYNRKYLEKNEICFDPNCPVYEDAVFNQTVLSSFSGELPILLSNTYCYNSREGSFSKRRGVDFVRDGMKTVEVYIQKAEEYDGIIKSAFSYSASFYLYCTLFGGLGYDYTCSDTSNQVDRNREVGYDLAGSFLERKDVIACLQEAQKIQCPPEKAWMSEKAIPWMIRRDFEKMLSKRLF